MLSTPIINSDNRTESNSTNYQQSSMFPTFLVDLVVDLIILPLDFLSEDHPIWHSKAPNFLARCSIVLFIYGIFIYGTWCFIYPGKHQS